MGDITRKKLLAVKICATYLAFIQSLHDVHIVIGSFWPSGFNSERCASNRPWRNMDSGKLLHTYQARIISYPSQTNTGQHIQAHGGGILKVGDKWYWYAILSYHHQPPLTPPPHPGSAKIRPMAQPSSTSIATLPPISSNGTMRVHCCRVPPQAILARVALSSALKSCSTRRRTSTFCGCTSTAPTTVKPK